MSVIQKLMKGAMADVDVLRSLDEQGDDVSVPRDVDFLLRAPSREKAELAAGFINDYRYGIANVEEDDEGSCSVQVIINMPVTQHVILSVSGFMACVAELFELEFDGWGCEIQED
jgi:hypothetical protein